MKEQTKVRAGLAAAGILLARLVSCGAAAVVIARRHEAGTLPVLQPPPS